jgi:MFS family permease
MAVTGGLSRRGVQLFRSLPSEFWLYFTGQTISNLGSAFTSVAVPLLVYRLTGSATELGATTAVNYLPWILFGLLGGALVDRIDRKRAMVVSDVVRGGAICVIPALAAVGDLSIIWIYVVVFVQACMQVVFSSGQFTAVVALVDKDQLGSANSLILASYSGATVAGSGLAGLMFSVLPVADALYVDGFSFLVSALSLLLVRRSFNEKPPDGLQLRSIRGLLKTLASDSRDGLGYVWHHPILRALSLQLMIVNLFGSAATAELALFATQRLGADNSQVGYLYAASGLGVVVLSLVVGPLNRRFRFSTVIMLALLLYGGGTVVFGLLSTYSVALGVMGIIGGATVLYNVSSATLRQRIVPNELLGRVWSIALTGAWCMIPVGSLGSGAIISATHNVRTVYVTVGVVIVVTAWLSYRLWLKAAPADAPHEPQNAGVREADDRSLQRE